jgi:hypothetical protein
MKTTRANRKMGRTNEMVERIRVELSAQFSQAEFELISLGRISREMEEKWFIFLEDEWLYFHRSWTGNCIFKLRLEPNNDGYSVAEAWANGDSGQYNRKHGLGSDSELITGLIKNLLLDTTNR